MVDLSFGWDDADALQSHAYVMPRVFEELDRLYRGAAIRLVDLGCGNGYVSNMLVGQGHEVVAVDHAPDGIEIGRRAYPAVRFELMSLEDERFAGIVGPPVDCVVALELIEHLFEPQTLFEQSKKVLKYGGYLVLSTPYHGYLKNLAISIVNGWDRHFTVCHTGGHIKFFSPASLGRMAEACGFRVIRWTGVGRVPLLWKSMVLVCQSG